MRSSLRGPDVLSSPRVILRDRQFGVVHRNRRRQFVSGAAVFDV